MGRFSIGMALAGGASWLASQGLISEDADSDPAKRALQYGSFAPNKLNLSGLKRVLGGGDGTWQSGDTTISTYPLGYFGLIMNVHANRWKRHEREGIDPNVTQETIGSLNPVLKELQEVLSAFLQMPILKGSYQIANMINEISRGEERATTAWTENTMKVMMSPLIPNTLQAFGRANGDYLPDLKGDTPLGTLANTIQFRYGKDFDGRPRYDLFGEPIASTPARS